MSVIQGPFLASQAYPLLALPEFFILLCWSSFIIFLLPEELSSFSAYLMAIIFLGFCFGHKSESGIVFPQSSLILREGAERHKGGESQIIDEDFVAEGLFLLDEHSGFRSSHFLLSELRGAWPQPRLFFSCKHRLVQNT